VSGGRGSRSAGPEPPGWAESFLRRVLPPGAAGESILSDLRREYAELAEARGRPPRLWYVREAAGLAAHYGWARLRGGGPGSAFGAAARDVRHAVRGLRRAPGFAAVALLTTGLGIGATVAIFSVVDSVLLEPLPYDEPDRLVAIWEWNVPRDRRTNVANPGNVRDWRDRSSTLEEVGAITIPQPAVLSAPGEPVEITVGYVTGNYFPILGLEPVLGRWPAAIDEDEGEPEALLTYRFWQERFGGSPEVAGTRITLNSVSTVVVGVLPPEHVVFGENVQLFAGFPMEGDQTTTGRYLYAIGRLAEGATLEQASDELAAIAEGLAEEYPDFNGGWSANVVPLHEQVFGDVRSGLWILFGAVGLLLLIACANVANLFLARATQRQREMAVRTSLGAGRARLAGQLLVESLVVAGAGALLGVGLAWLAVQGLVGIAPEVLDVPRLDQITLDRTVLLFAVVATVVTGLLFGTLPALQVAGVRPARALAAEGRGGGRESGRLRSGLVVAEVAISLALLVGAGLLARSFTSLIAVDPGLDAENVLTARVTLVGDDYDGTEPDARFFGAFVDEVQQIPGVDAAGAITFLPFTGLASATSYHPMDRPAAPRDAWPVAEVRNVEGGYFDALGVSLLRGRLLDDRDRPGSVDAVVVNQAMVDAQWPDEDPIGRSIQLSWDGLEELRVVGVVEDVHHHGLETTPRAMVYLPYQQRPYFNFMTLVVHSEVDRGALVSAMRERLRAIDPSLPLAQVRPMDEIVSQSTGRPRFTALLMGLFAVLAALLAAVGLYGVLSFAVARRVREIGVRVALGAEPGSVLGLVLRRGLLLVAAGVVVGLVAAVTLSRFLESLLFGVEPTDALTLAGAAGVLLLVGVVACLVPASRALRVDPVQALRSE